MNQTAPPAQSRSLLKLIGPGILVAATGVGAGDLATAAFTGQQLGVAVLWAVVLGAAIKFVLNEGLARWQLATGTTLLEGAVAHFGRIVQYLFLAYLLLWSFFVGAGLASACGVTAHALVPVFHDPVDGKIAYGIAHSLVGLAMIWVGGFQLFERVMSVCIGIMFVTVLVTAAMVGPDWGEVARGLFVPSIPQLDGPGLSWTIALMGGVGGTVTVLCYGYWIREAGRIGPEEMQTCRIDLATGYLMTALFGIGMVVIGSKLAGSKGSGATLVIDLANHLESTGLGVAGRWAFLIGAWGAVFSSLLGVWQSVPYLFADFWGLSHGGAEPGAAVDTRAWPYRGYLIGLALVPLAGLFVDFKSVQKLYALVGAAFMPALALALLVLNSRTAWIGPQLRNRWGTAIALILTVACFLLASGFEAHKTWQQINESPPPAAVEPAPPEEQGK